MLFWWPDYHAFLLAFSAGVSAEVFKPHIRWASIREAILLRREASKGNPALLWGVHISSLVVWGFEPQFLLKQKEDTTPPPVATMACNRGSSRVSNQTRRAWVKTRIYFPPGTSLTNKKHTLGAFERLKLENR